MRPDMLAVPAAAIAAAGRALQFTIAELSSQLKVMPPDSRAHSMVAEEMFVMQDAVKAFVSALPVQEDQSDRIRSLEEHLKVMISWGDTMWRSRPDADRFPQVNVALEGARRALINQPKQP